MITHRTSAIGVTNKLLLMRDGMAQLFGPSAEVLAEISKMNQQSMQTTDQTREQTKPQNTPQAAAKLAAPQVAKT